MLIKTTGEVLEISPKNGKDFKLKELQEYVGGNIECVRTHDNKMLIANETGKNDGLPYNEKATKEYRYGGYDLIVGDVVICNPAMVK